MFIRNYLPAKSNVRQTISIGNRLDVQPVNWGSSSKNIVLVLSTTCKYCKASAGFYQRLARECEDRHIRTIALFPQTVEQSRAYLESEGVRVTEIWQAEPGKLKVQGTPTVLLVDNNGLVQHVWTGKLPANQEKICCPRWDRSHWLWAAWVMYVLWRLAGRTLPGMSKSLVCGFRNRQAGFAHFSAVLVFAADKQGGNRVLEDQLGLRIVFQHDGVLVKRTHVS